MSVRRPASSEDAFYDQLTPETFKAGIATTGPWSPALQHGGPPAALLGRALELQGGPSGSRIARVAFDFFGPVPVSEVSVKTAVLRSGAKIHLSDAALTAGGRVVLRAAAWHVLAEPGRSPVVASSFVVPAIPPCETETRFTGMPRFPYADALEWRFANGGFDEPGPATVWTRCRIPLVRGDVLTGLQRVLIMVDAANGVSAVLPFAAWTFVPIDLMLTAQRLPHSEWVGMSAKTTIGSDGIGITETVLFDADGAFGRALQTLYVAPR
jgi:hypothetical protein